jgi:hypothetical protein
MMRFHQERPQAYTKASLHQEKQQINPISSKNDIVATVR